MVSPLDVSSSIEEKSFMVVKSRYSRKSSPPPSSASVKTRNY